MDVNQTVVTAHQRLRHALVRAKVVMLEIPATCEIYDEVFSVR